jgi:hypothetical protein
MRFEAIPTAPRRRLARDSGIFQREACQVLPLSRLGTRAQAPDAPVDLFRDWQEHKLNLARQLDELRLPMDVWFYSRIETAAERPTPRAEKRKEFTPVFLPSASGGFCAS